MGQFLRFDNSKPIVSTTSILVGLTLDQDESLSQFEVCPGMMVLLTSKQRLYVAHDLPLEGTGTGFRLLRSGVTSFLISDRGHLVFTNDTNLFFCPRDAGFVKSDDLHIKNITDQYMELQTPVGQMHKTYLFYYWCEGNRHTIVAPNDKGFSWLEFTFDYAIKLQRTYFVADRCIVYFMSEGIIWRYALGEN